MSGSINLIAGMQRSGKTFLAALIATYYQKKYNIPVYTNMDIEEFIKISYLSDMPIDKEPKVLLLDELHFYLNSRNFKTQADFIYFLNTVCKRNILFLATCIHPDMIDKNLRIQLNYFTLCKSDNNNLHYKIFDVQNQTNKEIHFRKEPGLFDYTNYDTTEIPLTFHFDIDKYIKLNENKKYFN
ncbi:MAG: AAA family ATPase [Sedimentibacter sp.]|uniref:AAA family ATPase n=1 Tax=Sedimentibacter sp. TaxID=1960295 RepID=UPI0029824B65|nr:AAA family ATPase [Sedimentibacter sp.]MDW5300687.1 AAA family ATPase [Sedimentibacter sp.]